MRGWGGGGAGEVPGAPRPCLWLCSLEEVGREPRELPGLPHWRLGLVTQLLAAATWVWEPERHMFAAGTGSSAQKLPALGNRIPSPRTGGRTPEARPCLAGGAEGRCQVGEVGAFSRLTHPGHDDQKEGSWWGWEGPGRTL